MSAGKFLRKQWHQISVLGLRRKNKQKWRKPKGRHNKLREKRKSRGLSVSIGYGAPSGIKGMIMGRNPVRVRNVAELQKLTKKDIAVIPNLGMKKKIALVKKALEMNIKTNINEKKFLERKEKK